MNEAGSRKYTTTFNNEAGGKTTITAEWPDTNARFDIGDVKVRVERPQQEFERSLDLTAREASRLVQALALIGIE